MARRSKKPRSRRQTPARKTTGTSGDGVSEWVGGRVTMPMYVAGDPPYRPEMDIWLELPMELVVGNTLIDPAQPPPAFAESLAAAMRQPMVGPPRRPSHIRVANPQLAAGARAAAPEIEVVVAPTPELDRLLELMQTGMVDMHGSGASYLQDGNLSLRSMDRLFAASELLFRTAPWETANDAQVLRVDIPALDVEGGCLSIIGALGESHGFLLFPSLLAYEAFLDAANRRLEDGPIDLGTTTLSLTFDRAPDLPVGMRKEALKHGWPVAAPDAYPVVEHRDRDGMPRPTTPHDVEVITACATCLSVFFIKHRGVFKQASHPPVSESFVSDDGLEVRFTAPYSAAPRYASNDSPPMLPMRAAGSKVGRNDPCPCGSTKKYKKCCLRADQARSAQRRPAPIHEVDQRLVERMTRYALERFGEEWHRVTEDFDDVEVAIQLFATWSVYVFEVQGKPIVTWFLETEGRRLSTTERAWLGAQQDSWLSLWEVSEVEVGRSITLEDLLTGEQRTVQEVGASQSLRKRDVILGRIVDHDGSSLLCGMDPRALPPRPAAEVVRRVRGRLRRKTTVPVERLQNDKVGRYMIARWSEAVLEFDREQAIAPTLQNTDGDDLLFTVDHFHCSGEIDELAKCVSSIEGAEPTGDGSRSYVFTRDGNAIHRDWDNTVIGRAELTAGKLRLECNSVERSDHLRQRLEAACGQLLSHRAREHSDPASSMQEAPTGSAQTAVPPEIAAQMIHEYKTRHYADWIEHPLPALKGKSPREAMRTSGGRSQLDLLLKEHENLEARMPPEQRFDFSKVRADLGLR